MNDPFMEMRSEKLGLLVGELTSPLIVAGENGDLDQVQQAVKLIDSRVRGIVRDKDAQTVRDVITRLVHLYVTERRRRIDQASEYATEVVTPDSGRTAGTWDGCG